MMPLDEIMRREKFNDVEKALVDHVAQSHADRIKIISEIKIAKSNEKHAIATIFLTAAVMFLTAIDMTSDHMNSKLDLAYQLFSDDPTEIASLLEMSRKFDRGRFLMLALVMSMPVLIGFYLLERKNKKWSPLGFSARLGRWMRTLKHGR